jgi:NitT/TauT family transport system ATP-binding protein
MGVSIQIDKLTHRFHKQATPVISDFSLEIPAGQSLAIIGESGCGKSTLLHMLAGLTQPSRGCVRIQGERVLHPHPEWNMMFQRPALYPWLNVEQNVALGLEFTGQTRGLKAKVAEMLELVGLADRGRAKPQDLSGGQQQRVALARSLAVSPEVILLDEPFSALDAFTRRALQHEVTQIAHDHGITLVLVTHDIDEALIMADRVAVMGRNPGTLRSLLDVPLAYSRDPKASAVKGLRDELMSRFHDSVSSGTAVPACSVSSAISA